MAVSARLSTLGGSTSSSQSLISVATKEYAEPAQKHVCGHLLEYLHIEMLQVISDAATLRLSQLRRNMEEIHLGFSFDMPEPLPEDPPEVKQQKHSEALRERLSSIGHRIGWSLADRLSKNRAPFNKVPLPAGQVLPPNAIPQYDSLELVKFLCKDVWTYLYNKQIDNLRTNHRGVFVLHDNSFKTLTRFSCSSDIPEERKALAQQALHMLYLPSGIIKGVLCNLGLFVTVTPELGTGAACSFQIKTVK